MTTPAFIPALPSPLAEVAAASLSAALLAGAVRLVCLAAGRRLPAAWQAALWLLVFVRLALPAVPQVGWHPTAAFRSGAAPPARSTGDVPPRPFPTAAAAPVPTAAPPEGMTGSGGVPPRPVAPPPALTLPRLLLAAWAAGFAVCLARFAVRWRRLRRTAGRRPPVTDPATLDLWNRCRAEAGVRRAVRLLVAPPGWGAATGGCLRPTVLLPADLLAGPPADLRAVLLHELAHVRRFDVPADRVVSLLCCAHWFNPAAWWAAARWRAARESACDDAVLTRLAPADRPAYGRLVLGDSLRSLSRPDRAAPTFGVGFGASPLPERIAVIASFAPPTRRRRIASAAAFAALAAVGLTAAGPPGESSPADAVAPAVPPAGEAAADDAAPALPSYLTGPVLDVRTGAPLTRTPDGVPLRVVAEGPDGFRHVAELTVDGPPAKRGVFRIAAPRGRVRLSTDPVLPIVGTQETAEELDAVGATFLIESPTVTQLAPLFVLPPWPATPPPVESERAAAAAVTALGGRYELDENRRVVGLNFDGLWKKEPDPAYTTMTARPTEADVTHLLAKFPELRRVRAMAGQITDRGLEGVGSLPNLREFDLFGKPTGDLTAAGATRLLAVAPRLEEVYLHARGPEFEAALEASPTLRRAAIADDDTLGSARLLNLPAQADSPSED